MGFLNKRNNVVVVAQTHDNDIDNVDAESASNSSERNTISTSDYSRKSAGESKEALIDIARTEQRHVRIIRIVTFAVVIVCAVSVSTLVYCFTRGSDILNFELEVSVLQRIGRLL
jgi:hypothetical protein